MAKKRVKIGGKPLEETVPKKIPAEKYWEMRAYAEAMEHDNTKVLLARSLEARCRLEQMLASERLQTAEIALKKELQSSKDSVGEYNKIKEDIEKLIGRPLTNCSVNPITYEIMEDSHGTS